jgi:hypothetical protein
MSHAQRVGYVLVEGVDGSANDASALLRTRIPRSRKRIFFWLKFIHGRKLLAETHGHVF